MILYRNAMRRRVLLDVRAWNWLAILKAASFALRTTGGEGIARRAVNEDSWRLDLGDGAFARRRKGWTMAS